MRLSVQIHILILLVGAVSLGGCGVTKLWGQGTAGSAVPEITLRERAAELGNPVWDVEEKRSLMNQMASVLVNGARSAGQALDVFDWTGDESPETRQARKYLAQLKEREKFKSYEAEMSLDLQGKIQAADTFQIAASSALKDYQDEFETISGDPENANRKDRLKRLHKNADEDRRAAVQASKSLRQQASIFDAATKALKSQDGADELTTLENDVTQLLARADELRTLAEDLDQY